MTVYVYALLLQGVGLYYPDIELGDSLCLCTVVTGHGPVLSRHRGRMLFKQLHISDDDVHKVCH